MKVENEKSPFPSRREFISLGVGAFVVGSIPFAARTRRRLIRRTLPVMGTLGEVAVVHKDERYAQGAIDAAFQELRRVESLLTRFETDSEVGRLNRLAMEGAQGVSRETAEVLAASLRWAEVSEGAFDPCLAGAMALWDVGRRSRPPASSQVSQFSRRGLFRDLELGKSQGRDVVVFHQNEMGIDLGGIGKGYGVDRAADALRAWGIQDALVNVGGDLYALGTSEDGDPWKVGVQNPDDPQALIATLRMSDRAVATSGDYQQYFEHDGRRYHHLLDPSTGAPSKGTVRSVTVASASCLHADAGATAAFVAPSERAPTMFGKIDPDMEVVYTV